VHETVQGVGLGMPVLEALSARRTAWATLSAARPEIRAYLRRALADADEAGKTLFRLLLEEERSQLQMLMDKGLARRTEDIDATVVVYFTMVSAAMIIGPFIDDVFGIDVTTPEGIARLQRAEVDLLTTPLFPPDPAVTNRRSVRGGGRPGDQRSVPTGPR
jgi:hypothetical protein